MNWDDSFSIISFNYSTTDPDDAYVISNLESGKTAVLLYDEGGQGDQEIFAHRNMISPTWACRANGIMRSIISAGRENESFR